MYVKNGSLVRFTDLSSNDEIFELKHGDIGIIIIDRKYRLPDTRSVECVRYDDKELMFYTSNGNPIPVYAVFQYIRLQQSFQDLINKYGNFR